MGAGFATVAAEEGILSRSADVNGFTVTELRFAPGYVQPEFEPELPYLAVVLEGGLEKSFRLRTMPLGQACGVTMPAGAEHGARFSSNGARIIVVRPRCESSPAVRCLDRLSELRDGRLSWLGWRLAAELRASDAAAPLAAEGFALELLAMTSRERAAERRLRRTPPWLRAAEELLRERVGDRIGLAELADSVGVHPTHLARVFRARHGLSVGEYGRRLRLAWAAAQLAGGDTPLATIAMEAGFADQAHFTRLFKRQIGTTPARYREETQGNARRVPG